MDSPLVIPATPKSLLFIGVNLTHTDVTAVAVSDLGQEVATATTPFANQGDCQPLKGRHEQHPDVWWDATRATLVGLVAKLRNQKISPSQLKGISVCGEPGAILILDRGGHVLMPAILADDVRATDQTRSINFHGQDHCQRMGFQFNASHALSKIAWVKENYPEVYENAMFAHQTDYIVGKLKGLPDVTEYSLSIHTGADLIDECWPDWLDYDLHLGVRERLPRLTSLGANIGTVIPIAAATTGLPVGLPILNGTASDTAAFLASGARRTGDFSTMLDTNMAISGMTTRMLTYSNQHLKMSKLPGKVWFFATNSNTGAEWIKVWFNETDLPEFQSQAPGLLPCSYLAYPNVRKGETFPFNSNAAEGFISPATDNHPVQFAACLQGTAMLEQLCYKKLAVLAETSESAPLGATYSGGRWSLYDAWMQCRSDITGRVNHRLASLSAPPFGAAMIAALGSHFKSVEKTADSMVHVAKSFYPNPQMAGPYKELFHAFESLMEDQGYF